MARKYKETPRPAGVYRVVHRPSGRTLLGSSPDAPAMLNRVRFQLRTRGHPNHVLQSDWDADGPHGFLFEVVDFLPPSETMEEDLAEALSILEALWREKLDLPEDSLY